VLDKKDHFLNDESYPVMFAGSDVRHDLIIGKYFISILNGFNISLIIYSYAVIFYDISVIGKKISFN